jgi:nucleotide-binding universal stress UspA family protein
MYTTIVVGTDGSTTAAHAVRQATELAKALGAKLHVVHAFQPASATAAIGLGGGADSLGVTEAIESLAREVLQEAAEHVADEGVAVESHLQVGDPASALLDVAERVDADLLVVGNKGMSGARRFLLGSVPNKVSHHCPCSLLIVNTSQ